MDYYEKKFIRDGGAKLRYKAYVDSLSIIKTIYGDEAYKEELLSELPVRGVLITDPYTAYYVKKIK
tara:strand:- start:666 stop:863 length:198 start_codon:yes stop_codon:yes gene_type:complete